MKVFCCNFHCHIVAETQAQALERCQEVVAGVELGETAESAFLVPIERSYFNVVETESVKTN